MPNSSKNASPFTRFRQWLGNWPLVRLDLKQYLQALHVDLEGITLNAGSGEKDYGLDGRLIKIDILLENKPNILGDLHQIPLKDESVHNVLAICVLEHVKNPSQVLSEFFRILKKGGQLVVEVPFTNPIHAAPYDFYRFTIEGMKNLLEDNHFLIRNAHRTQPLSYYFIWELWLKAKSLRFLFFRSVAVLTLKFFAVCLRLNQPRCQLLKAGQGYSQFVLRAEKK